MSEIIERSQQISGLFSGTMSRDPEYEFLMLGRNLERSDMTTQIIDVAGDLLVARDEMINDHDTIPWASVSRSASAHQMYRRNVRSRVTPARVLHFLLNDLNFPPFGSLLPLADEVQLSSPAASSATDSGS